MNKAYEGWLEARANGNEREYLHGNFLSRNTLLMLQDLRNQFFDHLQSINFVEPGDPENPRVFERRRARHSKLSGDWGGGLAIASYNRYASHPALVKAVLCAGLYPNVVHIQAPRSPFDEPLLLTRDGAVQLHPISVNFGKKEFYSAFFVYHELVKTTRVRWHCPHRNGTAEAKEAAAAPWLGDFPHPFRCSSGIARVLRLILWCCLVADYGCYMSGDCLSWTNGWCSKPRRGWEYW